MWQWYRSVRVVAHRHRLQQRGSSGVRRGSECVLSGQDGRWRKPYFELGGVFDCSLWIIKADILEVRATLGEDHLLEVDSSNGDSGSRHAGIQAGRADI